MSAEIIPFPPPPSRLVTGLVVAVEPRPAVTALVVAPALDGRVWITIVRLSGPGAGEVLGPEDPVDRDHASDLILEIAPEVDWSIADWTLVPWHPSDENTARRAIHALNIGGHDGRTIG
jgi:hypothetical protein